MNSVTKMWDVTVKRTKRREEEHLQVSALCNYATEMIDGCQVLYEMPFSVLSSNCMQNGYNFWQA
jgi:hypothetical protein